MNVDCSLISWYLAKKLKIEESAFESKILNCNSLLCLQCFDAVGWAAGRASGL